MLVEAPVGLDTFGLPRHDFRSYGVTGLADQFLVFLQQGTYQYVTGQPNLVLSRHAEAGVVHHFDSSLSFLSRELGFEK